MSQHPSVGAQFRSPKVSNTMADKVIKLRFNLEKETKNTIKFEEEERDGQPKVVGSLYLQKFAAGKAVSLDVTITPVL